MEDLLKQEQEWAARAMRATEQGAHAYARLLHLAETRDSGQIPRVARFLASTYNGTEFLFDLYELRTVDVDIGDDMLLCLDALRWGKRDLHALVENGAERIEAVIGRWGLRWTD